MKVSTKLLFNEHANHDKLCMVTKYTLESYAEKLAMALWMTAYTADHSPQAHVSPSLFVGDSTNSNVVLHTEEEFKKYLVPFKLENKEAEYIALYKRSDGGLYVETQETDDEFVVAIITGEYNHSHEYRTWLNNNGWPWVRIPNVLKELERTGGTYWVVPLQVRHDDCFAGAYDTSYWASNDADCVYERTFGLEVETHDGFFTYYPKDEWKEVLCEG